jgi:TPR repeat protein
MHSLWTDRLAEIWAEPGNAGSGVIVGGSSVLSARHVIANASPAGKILARIVRADGAAGSWVASRIAWESTAWDLAMLSPLDADEAGWLRPTSSSPSIVRLDPRVRPGCEAVGFPHFAVQESTAAPDPTTVRQPEHLLLIALPVGNAKPPVNPDRQLPKAWLPFDVETSTPDSQPGWRGLSGAGVAHPDGRLIGVVVSAESQHQNRRLYAVPLASVLANDPSFVAALEAAGNSAIAEIEPAPELRRTLLHASIGADGLPLTIDKVELATLGVAEADLPGESPYIDYVERDVDQRIRAALSTAPEQRRLVLVTGGAGAGKSRSVVEAVRAVYPNHRVLLPRTPATVGELPGIVAELDVPMVLVLDSAARFALPGLRAALEDSLEKGVAVVGSIRRSDLESLSAASEASPAQVLKDQRFVRLEIVKIAWSKNELALAERTFANGGLLTALKQGIAIGAFTSAGPLLVQRLREGRGNDETPERYRLLSIIIDWYRTGINAPVPAAFVREQFFASGYSSAQYDAALEWCSASVIGAGANAQRLVSPLGDRLLELHSLIIEHTRRFMADSIPRQTWDAAARSLSSDQDRIAFALSALNADERDIAVSMLRPMADRGDPEAMYELALTNPEDSENLLRRSAESGFEYAIDLYGVILSSHDKSAAREWFEKRSSEGRTVSMNNLAVLLRDDDPEGADSWLRKSADRGNSEAMLSLSYVASDPNRLEEGEAWLWKAANAGNAEAMLAIATSVLEPGSEESMAWVKRAAEAGDIRAVRDLASRALDDGDLAGALEILESAAAQGESEAMAICASLLKDSDPEASFDWLVSAANARHHLSMFVLGLTLAEADDPDGIIWLKRAASAGLDDAMVSYANAIVEGDPSGAVEWWKRAADDGNVTAMMNLSRRFLAEGDATAAEDWAVRASDTGDAQAVSYLEDFRRETGLVPRANSRSDG